MSLTTRAAPEQHESMPHLTRLVFGGDYNPEQWPEDVWLEDARLMREAGVNLVSVGIFAWARLEPAPDVYDFGWLDRVVDVLHGHGVRVNLATPTASAPPWLVRLHPEILPVTADGVTLWHGSRRHACASSPAYRERARRVVQALADHYRSHPALAMWHVDNEFACHVSECFCDASAAAFRQWLRDRHGSLNGLNDAWGTAFWSQAYGDWEEIHPPRATPSFHNPAHRLDWQRFTSDSWLGCFREQKEIIRAATPRIPVTTNFMNFHGPLDYWAWAANEDVVSNDSYPDTSVPDWMIDAAMGCDLMRSLGGGRPWILMEQATGNVNWRPRNATKRPGIMRLGSYQAIARGANGVMFFQWRASVAGAEKYHSAMVPHGGTDTRAWREVRALGAELAGLDAVTKSTVRARAAIVFDWESWWAFELDGKPSNEISLLGQVRVLYAALFARNLTVDFVHPLGDLSPYGLVFAPHLYLVEDEAIHNLSRWVAAGGTLVMTFMSGIVDRNDRVRPGPYPSAFRELLGLEIEEFMAYPADESNTVAAEDGARFDGTRWMDVIRDTGCEVLARFDDDFIAGRPAVTRNAVGSGTAYYVGTALDAAGLGWLLGLTVAASGVTQSHADNGRDGTELEIVERIDERFRWTFAMNYSSGAVDLDLDTESLDVLTGTRHSGSVRVEPTDLVILRAPVRVRGDA